MCGRVIMSADVVHHCMKVFYPFFFMFYFYFLL
jgi:hypothetical protein